MDKYKFIGGFIYSIDLTLNRTYYVKKLENNKSIFFPYEYGIIDDFWINEIKYERINLEEAFPKEFFCLISKDQLDKFFVKL